MGLVMNGDHSCAGMGVQLEWVRVVGDGASNTVVQRSYWVRFGTERECRNTQGDAQESFGENEFFIFEQNFRPRSRFPPRRLRLPLT